jgi:signal peptidase I
VLDVGAYHARVPRHHALAFRRFALTVIETLVSTVIVFVLLQTFVARTFGVEQTSMEGTLEPGQEVIVDRLTPNFSPYKAGDIVVFTAPELTGRQEPLIKRVVAIGGDRVDIRAGRVYVNGVALDEPYTYDGEPTDPMGHVSTWVVPVGSLFVLGDHRAVSVDSRVFGPIPVSSVVGRAWLRVLPLNQLELLSR